MNELDKLRSLLFAKEREVLDDLSRRVAEPEPRATDVADVLPEAMRQSHRDGKLADALKDPVEDCLQESFQEKPKAYADALYPIMGPAIRKSILETLRSMVQTVNQAVEQSLTPRGLKWRIQAWRAGIPFGQYVLQQRLKYRVEQAFLIQPRTGLLIAEASDESAVIHRDKDAVSAMFTAIQDFVRESFGPDDDSSLQTVDMGEFTVWAIHGSRAVLACVIRGVPPRSLREDLAEILEAIHLHHGSVLREFDGSHTNSEPVRDKLEHCLVSEANQDAGPEAQKRRPISPMLWLLCIVAAVFILSWLFDGWIKNRQLDRLRSLLLSEPGIVLTQAEQQGGKLLLKGLRDPLARDVSDIMQAVDIEPTDVVSEFRSYQSLDQAILKKRVEGFLNDDALEVSVQDTQLIIKGPVPGNARQRILTIAPALGVTRVVFSIDDQTLRNQILNLLSPPNTVTLRVDSGAAEFGGVAPLSWIEFATREVATLPGLVSAELSAVTSEESRRFASLLAELSADEFRFDEGTSLIPGETARLLDFAERTGELNNLAAVLGQAIAVSIVGHTDSIGAESRNNRLALSRAGVTQDALLKTGLVEDQISMYTQVPPTSNREVVGERKVLVSVKAVDE